MINISEKISSLRKAHNLTQEALGEAVGVSAQAVSKWEKGDSLPDISVIPDICRTFGISADTLIGNEGNMTSEMYIEKALELCKGPIEKIKLIHKLMANGKQTGISFVLSAAESFQITDQRGFGIYFKDIEFIKNMISVDLTKSELLKFMSDEKSIKLFSLICVNGRLHEREIIKLTGFSQQEITERLFAFMKFSIIHSVRDNEEEGGNGQELSYGISDNGIFLIGIMANTFLFEPIGRKGTINCDSFYNCNPDNLRKFID